MNKKEAIVQTLLLLFFLGFTLGSLFLMTMVYTAAPFSFFGLPMQVNIGFAFLLLGLVLLVALLWRRHKHKKS